MPVLYLDGNDADAEGAGKNNAFSKLVYKLLSSTPLLDSITTYLVSGICSEEVSFPNVPPAFSPQSQFST